MMFMCTSKFEIEEEQLLFLKEFHLAEEQEAANEERYTNAQEELDPISDDEVNNIISTQTQDKPATKGLSEKARGKRRQSVVSEGEDEVQEQVLSDDEADLPLPNTQNPASGRARKRSRREDDQYAYY